MHCNRSRHYFSLPVGPSDRSPLWSLSLCLTLVQSHLSHWKSRKDRFRPAMLWHFTTSFSSQWDLSCQRFLNFHGDARACAVDLQPHAGRRIFVRLFLALQFPRTSWRVWQPLWYPGKEENNTIALQNNNKHCQVFQRCFDRVLSLFRAPLAWPERRGCCWWEGEQGLQGCHGRPGWTHRPRLPGWVSAGHGARRLLHRPPRARCRRLTPCRSAGLALNQNGSPLPLPPSPPQGSWLWGGSCSPPWSSLKTAVGEVSPQTVLWGLVNILLPF